MTGVTVLYTVCIITRDCVQIPFKKTLIPAYPSPHSTVIFHNKQI